VTDDNAETRNPNDEIPQSGTKSEIRNGHP
jgi:hypothetical protein